MKEKAHLVIKISTEHEVVYQCSLCGQTFPLAENDPPKESMGKLWAAFKAHRCISNSRISSSEPPRGGGET